MDKRRTIAISDIHGCLDEFLQLLRTVGYTAAADRLVLLGDYVDRGPKSREVLDTVLQLKQEGEVIVLLGNHDRRFVDIAEDPDSPLVERFFLHGGMETLASYWEAARPGEPFDRSRYRAACAWIREHYPHHLDMLRQALLYYEEGTHVYVHAGLHPDYPDWRS